MATTAPTVYLAGPDVFLPQEIREPLVAEKKRILASFGLVGRAPLDNALDLDAILKNGGSLFDCGVKISDENEAMMRSCDAIIANLTPFRGVSADVGTAFELGFMRALGKTLAAYTIASSPFAERVVSEHCVASPCADGNAPPVVHVDDAGLAVERFEMQDNLMLHAVCPIFSPLNTLGGRTPSSAPHGPLEDPHPEVSALAAGIAPASSSLPLATRALEESAAAFPIALGLEHFTRAAAYVAHRLGAQVVDRVAAAVYADTS